MALPLPSGGVNGAPPWGVRSDIQLNAHWIWAESFTGTDEVWCRIVTGSHDYDDGMYPQATNGASDGQIHIGADDMTTVYVNGDQVGSTTLEQWDSTLRFAFSADCTAPTVYAFEVTDGTGVAGLIATINHCGETSNTMPNEHFDDTSGRNFIVGPTAMTQTDALQYCRQQGGDLASIHNEIEQAAAFQACSAVVGDTTDHEIYGTEDAAPHGCWIGLVDQYAEGTWMWTDASAVDYLNWEAGQPDNAQLTGEEALNTGHVTGDEDVVEMDCRAIGEQEPGRWNDNIEEGNNHAGRISGFYPLCETRVPIPDPPARWKCSSTCPDGWETSTFDDSAWPAAADGGINGSPPWSKHEVSDEAHWIWNAETGTHGIEDDKGYEHEGRQMCCRYTSDHQPINCNAARMRYTQDYLTITQCEAGNTAESQYTDGTYCNYDGLGSQGYDAAFNHFHSTGQMAGYIWHSELCNLDGTDVVLSQDCSIAQNTDGSWGSGAAQCGSVHGTAYFSVDNGYDFFVNGQHIGAGNDWTTTDRYTFEASCSDTTVYGIDAYDEGGVASIIGSIHHCGEDILTGPHWKCMPRCADEGRGADGNYGCTTAAGWHTAGGIDDWWWAAAADAGDNGAAPWGHRPDISGEAHWIWSADTDGHDAVRCRYESTHRPLDCPAAQARYWQDYTDVAAYNGAEGAPHGMEAYNHYTRYGQSSGTIWHSELCNTDGTNKNSECQVFHTSDEYEYQFLHEPLGPEKAITFSVRANNDAHIGFFMTTAAKEGRHYTVGPTPLDFQAARQYCVAQGQTLASIHTPLEQQQAYQACSAVVGPMPTDLNDFGNADATPHGCWIGLADLSQEGRFVWSDGSATDFLNWEPGQPDNYRMDGSETPNEGGVAGDEDVVELDCRPINGPGSEGQWNDNIEQGGLFVCCISADRAPPHPQSATPPITATTGGTAQVGGRVRGTPRLFYLGSVPPPRRPIP